MTETEGYRFPFSESEGEGLEVEKDALSPEPHAAYGAPRRRAPRLSQEDVFEAADGLLLQGIRVTIDRVRQQLGRGSPNTIQEHLESWWSGLGSRIRDIPGKEFPQLPQELSAQILKLWNTALDTSRESLLTALEAREADLDVCEAALAEQDAALKERSAVVEARLQSQSDAATLAREQLSVANQRAEALEAVLKGREADGARLQERAGALEKDLNTVREKQESMAAAHEAQRARLEERYESSEARWLQEVDRARQALKVATQSHEKQAKESRTAAQRLESERETLRREVQQLKAAARAEAKARTALETKVRQLSSKKVTAAKKKSARGGRS